VRIASSVCCAACCEGVRGLGRGDAGLAGSGIVDMRGCGSGAGVLVVGGGGDEGVRGGRGVEGVEGVIGVGVGFDVVVVVEWMGCGTGVGVGVGFEVTGVDCGCVGCVCAIGCDGAGVEEA
jgi:hypothetical protein